MSQTLEDLLLAMLDQDLPVHITVSTEIGGTNSPILMIPGTAENVTIWAVEGNEVIQRGNIPAKSLLDAFQALKK